MWPQLGQLLWLIQWCSIRSVSIALLNWTLLTSYIFIFGFTLSSLCYLSSILEKNLKYIWQTSFYFYRAQGKVMFSKASVRHSVHRRRSPSSLIGQRPPSTERPPWTETSLDRDLPLDRDPSRQRSPPDRDQNPSRQRPRPLQTETQTPLDGDHPWTWHLVSAVCMHPTAMHSFLGGLSLHLNHLIASRMANYNWPFGTLPFGLFGSNLDTRDLETYPRTFSGHFWNMSIFDDSRVVWVLFRKWVVSENQSFLDEGAIITPLSV